MNYEAMDELLKNEVVERHSYFQLKYFVVGKEPTTQAKLWRCLRELKARRETITAVTREIEETKDNLELARLDLLDNKGEIESANTSTTTATGAFGITTVADPHTAKKLEIQRRKLKRRVDALADTLAQLNLKLKYAEEEAEFFHAAFKSLEKVEPLKPFDDLDEQTKYWDRRLADELGMKLTLHQPLDVELVKTILALDNETPIKKQTTLLLESAQRRMVEINQEQRKQLAKEGA